MTSYYTTKILDTLQDAFNTLKITKIRENSQSPERAVKQLIAPGAPKQNKRNRMPSYEGFNAPPPIIRQSTLLNLNELMLQHEERV